MTAVCLQGMLRTPYDSIDKLNSGWTLRIATVDATYRYILLQLDSGTPRSPNRQTEVRHPSNRDERNSLPVVHSIEVDVISLNVSWQHRLMHMCDGRVSILQACTTVLHGYIKTLIGRTCRKRPPEVETTSSGTRLPVYSCHICSRATAQCLRSRS